MKLVGIRMSDELHEKLKEKAKEVDRPLSNYIRITLEEMLKSEKV